MCGRFANHVQAMHEWLDILGDWPADIPTGYNVAPTQIIPAVQAEGTLPMRWGLVPTWSKEAAPKYATFNARLESVADKPAFRNAWRRSQTCLVPSLGYYEWRTESGGKQPYFIHPPEPGGLLVFAGLWEQREGRYSCTILTRPSDGELARLHGRMPVMLSPEDARCWLTDGTDSADRLGQSAVYLDARFHAVDRAVGNPRSQGEELIQPVRK